MSFGFIPALLCALLLGVPGLAMAQPIKVTANQIGMFKGANTGEPADRLIWLGGLDMNGPPESFGGISGVTFIDPGRLVFVTDKGNFISGTLEHDAEGRPTGIGNAIVTAIQNSKGADLPPNYSRDAEAIETIYQAGRATGIRVGFENLTRVADFDLVDGHPDGAAREVDIPDQLAHLRSNESLETVCIAPDTSPVAGSTLLVAEDLPNQDGDHSAWLLGHRDKGTLSLSVTAGFSPTDCDFLPDGDLLILERGVGFLAFGMQVRRIPATNVHPGARMTGEVILAASGGDIDNMEGLAVRELGDGTTHLIITADDNFNDWERSLLLEFQIPHQKDPQ